MLSLYGDWGTGGPEMARALRDFNALQRELRGAVRSELRSVRATASPHRVRFVEDGGEFVFVAELPGVDASDLTVALENRELIVRAKRKTTARPGFKVLRQGRPSESFETRIPLPSEVSAEAIEAHLSAGVLRVVLPKSNVAPTRTIPVQMK